MLEQLYRIRIWESNPCLMIRLTSAVESCVAWQMRVTCVNSILEHIMMSILQHQRYKHCLEAATRSWAEVASFATVLGD